MTTCLRRPRRRDRSVVTEASGGPSRVAATVSGQVQGVGFRWFIAREARQLGLVGWVANAADGSVRFEAEGERASIDRLLELARNGPPGARVEHVSVTAIEPLGREPGFGIRPLAHPGD